MKSGILGLVAVLALPGTAWGHGDEQRKPPARKQAGKAAEEKAFGRSGIPKNAQRSVHVGMDDSMRFTPDNITVKQGETVRFVARNNGKIMHEMVLGTMKELKEHAALMKKFPGMEHDEAYMAHVAPGKQEQIVWQFTRPGEFYYACLLPGHLEAGMIGKITVNTR